MFIPIFQDNQAGTSGHAVRFDRIKMTSQTGQMKSLNATDFKAGCLALLDEVARSGESLTITKRGKPVAQLVPIRPSHVRYPQDALRGTVHVHGDIVSPVLDPAEWESVGPPPKMR